MHQLCPSLVLFKLGRSQAKAQNKESLIRLYSICSWYDQATGGNCNVEA
jgi:hypothetical protein